MILAHPRALFWGLVAIPSSAFISGGPAPAAAGGRRMAVAEGPGGGPSRAAWRPWRGPLSLLLQLLMLACLVWAMADPRAPVSLTPLAQQSSYAAEEAGQMAAAISSQAQRPEALGDATPSGRGSWPRRCLLLVVEWGLYQRRWTS